MNPWFFSSILNIPTPMIDTMTNSLSINWKIIISSASLLARINHVPSAGTIINSTGNKEAINKLSLIHI